VHRIADGALVVLLLGLAAAIVGLDAAHGPVVLSLSATHGIDVWDLPAAPFAIGAIVVARTRWFGERSAATWCYAAPAATITLGVLLALAGVLTREGGPLVPAGGGVFDQTITQVVDRRPVPVGRWTYLALTYDGSQERLYVNGDLASRHPAGATLETPGSPLWIGGNRPWGSHFEGLIDDVRVYSRALSPAELRVDMTRPAGPAPGLAAGYAFDDGSGATVRDASGHDNTGRIDGATWTRGRHGDALRFDGDGSAVRIESAPSLNLTTSMTLSAWIRPEARQRGWRTIIQRQTAAYFLTASSARVNQDGVVDDVRVSLIAIAGAWLVLLIALRRAPAAGARRRWWVPIALFVLGSVADAALTPHGTVIGPMLVALWIAATAADRGERALLRAAALACAAVSLLAFTGWDALSHNDGGTARTGALGAVLVLAGVAAARHARKLPPRPSVS
jgi:hypothetical protein